MVAVKVRIIELLNKVSLPITNEEAEVLQFVEQRQQVYKSELDPRQQLLANQLVNRDVIYRINENGRIVYRKKIK